MKELGELVDYFDAARTSRRRLAEQVSSAHSRIRAERAIWNAPGIRTGFFFVCMVARVRPTDLVRSTISINKKGRRSIV